MEKMFRLFFVSVFILFFIGTITAQTNMLPNGDLETIAPGFWNKLNEGNGNSVFSWDLENGYEGSRCLKVEKSNVSTDKVGWKSVDNAYLYWNHAMAERVYNVSFRAKSQGVNTNPVSDDDKIGVLFEFYAGGNLLGEQFVAMDQSAASTDWTEYTGEGLLIPAGPNPDEMYATAYMGKNATGTVWFDDVNCGCDPWEMGIFNGNFETPLGWMEWHDGNQGFSNTVQGDAHSGDWSALLHEWDNNSDEMVFYSEPVAAEPNKWYKISVWTKWDSINTDDNFLPSNVTPEFNENRLGMCFFFHKDPLLKSWELTGGDQFFYFGQRDSVSDWVQYNVIAKSPEDAAGVSCRARFNPYPVGKVWYDDFTIEPVDAVFTSVEEFDNFGRIEMPQDFVLSQNFPNPFNPVTTIQYSVPKDGNIQITIYDMLGRKVRTLFDGFRTAGNHFIQWNACDESGVMLASGVYFVTLKSGDFVTAKRVTLLK